MDEPLLLSAVSTDNDDVHTMICSCSHFVSTRKSKTKKKLLSKRFERSLYWNDYKTKSESKHSRNEYIYNFSNQNLSVLVDCLV